MSDTPGPLPPPPRRSHGCLWGCLIAAGIVIAAGITLYFTTMHLLTAMKDTDAVKTVAARLDHDALAHTLFGDHVAIGSVSQYSMHSDFDNSTTTFQATLSGSAAAGSVDATVVVQNHVRSITSLVLTGPDGRRYDITHGDPPTPGAI